MSSTQSKCCFSLLTLPLPLLSLSNFVITRLHGQMEKLRLLQLLFCLEHEYIAQTF